MLLEALQLPLTTPFYPDGRLNFLKLEHNAARYSRTPVAGLVALSDSGEPTMLSEEETRQTLRSVAQAAGAGEVVMARVSAVCVVGDRVSPEAALAVAPVKVAAKTRTKVIGFQVLAGGTAGMLEGLRAGAVGAMPAFAASAPQACYEVLAAWKDGDEGLAQEKQVRLQRVVEKVEEELGVAGNKFGCDLDG